MPSNSIALHLQEFNSPALLVFSDKLYKSFLTSVIFTSPKPTLAQQLAANTALKEALKRTGTRSNHGSSIDQSILKKCDKAVRKNISNLAKYVVVEEPDNPTAWEGIGFVLRKPRAKLNKSEAVQNFHQAISRLTSLDEIDLVWKRPLGSQKWTRLTYRVMRSHDSNVEHAVQIGLVINKCKFKDHVKGLATVQYYWIIPVNTYGNGMISELCIGVALRM
jgi:hypothetical protein